jgi:hypothetical protein
MEPEEVVFKFEKSLNFKSLKRFRKKKTPTLSLPIRLAFSSSSQALLSGPLAQPQATSLFLSSWPS